MTERAVGSAGQSASLTLRRSQVRILYSPLVLAGLGGRIAVGGKQKFGTGFFELIPIIISLL